MAQRAVHCRRDIVRLPPGHIPHDRAPQQKPVQVQTTSSELPAEYIERLVSDPKAEPEILERAKLLSQEHYALPPD